MKTFAKLLIVLLAFEVASARVLSEEELKLIKDDSCYRPCVKGDRRVCYYHWFLENYHILGSACGSCGKPGGNISDCFALHCIAGDGFLRGSMSINRKMPGDSIHVCLGDLIVVDVTNRMDGTGTSIHWHGFHQIEAPHYDGVPYVTQCPIDSGSTFRYAYDADNAGTQWFHSHSGHHKSNGVYGGLVVRRPRSEDPNSAHYDLDLPEHLIVISDWLETYAEMFMPGLPGHPTGTIPTNILINGRGTRRDVFGNYTTVPLETFYVQRGQRYRFRIVNAMSSVCPAVVEIDHHSLVVIATDSYDVQPANADSIYSNAGERYDFVVNANQSGEKFLIRVKALGACTSFNLNQYAILSYEANPRVPNNFESIRSLVAKSDPWTPSLKAVNHPNAICQKPRNSNNVSTSGICASDLSSYESYPDITTGKADKRFTLVFQVAAQSSDDVFDEHKYDPFLAFTAGVTVGVINNISSHFPDFPLLTQPENINEAVFCDQQNCPRGKACHCIHRLKVKKDEVVEMVLIDAVRARGSVTHPIHLHGYQIVVMGMGHFPNNYSYGEKLDMIAGLRPRRTENVLKDTISLPSNGYAIFRFKASNPGFWLLHCHFEFHLSGGMGLVVQVGEPSEMVKPPKGFPKCGSFTPTVVV